MICFVCTLRDVVVALISPSAYLQLDSESLDGTDPNDIQSREYGECGAFIKTVVTVHRITSYSFIP